MLSYFLKLCFGIVEQAPGLNQCIYPWPKGGQMQMTGKLCKKGMTLVQGGKDGKAACQQKDLWVVTG